MELYIQFRPVYSFIDSNYSLESMNVHQNRKKIDRIGRVAGIEPTSLAWKARGYSRRRCKRFARL